MKRISVFFALVLALLQNSCDNPFAMREPVPVVVQTPVKNDPLKFADSIFLIELNPGDVRVTFEGDLYIVNSFPELDTRVRKSGGVTLNGSVALKCDSEPTHSRI